MIFQGFCGYCEECRLCPGIVEEKYPALQKEAVRFGLYQRLDYLLHIPVGLMVREDSFYTAVKNTAAGMPPILWFPPT